jgi:hypothetical protein
MPPSSRFEASILFSYLMLRLMKIFLSYSQYFQEILDVAYTVLDVRFNLPTRFKLKKKSRRGYIE